MNRKRLIKYLLCWFCVMATYSLTYAAKVEFPLIQSMSYFPYSNNALQEKGKLSWGIDVYYSNVYMFDEERTTLNDFETMSAAIGIRYGLRRGTTLELYYRHTAIFGGFLDKFIEDFHRAFNMPDNRRPDYPRDAVHYKYYDYFSYTSNENAASPLVAALLQEIYRSGHFSLKGRLSLGLPLSKKPGFSSDKPFLTGGLVMNYARRKFSLEWANYLSFYKKPTWLGDEDIHTSLFYSGLEAYLGRFIFGFTFRSSVFKTGDLASDGYQAYFGYKFTRFLEFIILEDFYPFDTTPDICFNIRLRFL